MHKEAYQNHIKVGSTINHGNEKSNHALLQSAGYSFAIVSSTFIKIYMMI